MKIVVDLEAMKVITPSAEFSFDDGCQRVCVQVGGHWVDIQLCGPPKGLMKALQNDKSEVGQSLYESLKRHTQ